MGKIYNAPDSIVKPKWDCTREEEEKYLNDISEFCKKRNPSKNVGEVLRIPYADGHAIYVIASMSPVQLVHIATGDAWDYPMAHRLTKKDIEQRLSFNKLFTK